MFLDLFKIHSTLVGLKFMKEGKFVLLLEMSVSILSGVLSGQLTMWKTGYETIIEASLTYGSSRCG
mgnify:CR=1 FL=1